MKERIKNFAFLDKIQGLQLKISKCFESKNIIYCNSIFVQFPTIQVKIVELNPISFLRREDIITITLKEVMGKEITQIESTRNLTEKETEKLKRIFNKSHSETRLIITEDKEDDFEESMEFTEDIIREQREAIETNKEAEKEYKETQNVISNLNNY